MHMSCHVCEDSDNQATPNLDGIQLCKVSPKLQDVVRTIDERDVLHEQVFNMPSVDSVWSKHIFLARLLHRSPPFLTLPVHDARSSECDVVHLCVMQRSGSNADSRQIEQC